MLLNDVAFALNAALASGIWVLQVVLVKVSYTFGSVISSV